MSLHPLQCFSDIIMQLMYVHYNVMDCALILPASAQSSNPRMHQIPLHPASSPVLRPLLLFVCLFLSTAFLHPPYHRAPVRIDGREHCPVPETIPRIKSRLLPRSSLIRVLLFVRMLYGNSKRSCIYLMIYCYDPHILAPCGITTPYAGDFNIRVLRRLFLRNPIQDPLRHTRDC